MNLDSMISEAQAAQAAQLATAEKRRTDEKQRRALNAEKTSTHLREVVLPVLLEARKKINSSTLGVSSVESTSRMPDNDEYYPHYELSYRLTLRRIIDGKRVEAQHVFSIQGDSESATVQTSIRFADSPHGWIGGAVTRLYEITPEWVEGEFGAFFKTAITR